QRKSAQSVSSVFHIASKTYKQPLLILLWFFFFLFVPGFSRFFFRLYNLHGYFFSFFIETYRNSIVLAHRSLDNNLCHWVFKIFLNSPLQRPCPKLNVISFFDNKIFCDRRNFHFKTE